LSWRAGHWLFLRLAFEGSCGSIAYVLTASAAGLDQDSQVIRVVVAGLAGSTILRAQLAVDSKGKSRAFGPGTFYQRLRKEVDDNIDDIGGVAQSRWITDRVLPTISNLPLQEIARQAETYFNNLSRFTAKEHESIARFIGETVLEEDTLDEQKRRVLVQRIIDEGGRRFVKSLVKRYGIPSSRRAFGQGVI
jgi:hypothetical protein